MDYLRFGLKRTYSKACVELLAVEMKLKRRKTRSGTPRICVSCLWMMCSLYDICCWVFLLNLYHPITFYNEGWKKKALAKDKNDIICWLQPLETNGNLTLTPKFLSTIILIRETNGIFQRLMHHVKTVTKLQFAEHETTSCQK